MDKIERAAAKHRKHEAKAHAPAPPVDMDARERDHRKDIVTRSLGGEVGGGTTWAIVIVVVLVGLGGGAYLASRVHGDGAVFAVAAAMAVFTLGAGIGLPFLIPVLVGTFRRSRLSRIGPGFDVGGYLEQLAQNRRKGQLLVTLAVRGELRADIPDAVRGWMPELASAEWDGPVLRLASAELEGVYTLSGGRYGGASIEFSNVRFHHCLMHIRHHVMKNLDVERIEVSITGEIERWDANP